MYLRWMGGLIEKRRQSMESRQNKSSLTAQQSLLNVSMSRHNESFGSEDGVNQVDWFVTSGMSYVLRALHHVGINDITWVDTHLPTVNFNEITSLRVVMHTVILSSLNNCFRGVLHTALSDLQEGLQAATVAKAKPLESMMETLVLVISYYWLGDKRSIRKCSALLAKLTTGAKEGQHLANWNYSYRFFQLCALIYCHANDEVNTGKSGEIETELEQLQLGGGSTEGNFLPAGFHVPTVPTLLGGVGLCLLLELLLPPPTSRPGTNNVNSKPKHSKSATLPRQSSLYSPKGQSDNSHANKINPPSPPGLGPSTKHSAMTVKHVLAALQHCAAVFPCCSPMFHVYNARYLYSANKVGKALEECQTASSCAYSLGMSWYIAEGQFLQGLWGGRQKAQKRANGAQYLMKGGTQSSHNLLNDSRQAFEQLGAARKATAVQRVVEKWTTMGSSDEMDLNYCESCESGDFGN
eukprot:TRINITY_DN84180_c0_g1_i1.p1 TRINITY_DN84180_c0_g1~~TRINITY_DN84180_c0_g1_i1.p1  ORF type:complete len:545 (-),score=23.45 TRINITY_DN84180_c0_g1_i1:45-1442(-)